MSGIDNLTFDCEIVGAIVVGSLDSLSPYDNHVYIARDKVSCGHCDRRLPVTGTTAHCPHCL